MIGQRIDQDLGYRTFVVRFLVFLLRFKQIHQAVLRGVPFTRMHVFEAEKAHFVA